MSPLLQFALIAAGVVVGAWLLAGRRVTVIYPPNVGLLYRNGRFEREIPPGRDVRFDPFHRSHVVTVSLAEQPLVLAEATVLSKDQFSFRLGLAPVLKVVDARRFIESQDRVAPSAEGRYPDLRWTQAHMALQTIVAAAAIEVAATRSLAEMLGNQRQLAEDIRARLSDGIPGAVVDQLLLTAINLPPETRKLFTDVERAKMEAQAAVERARGEQAALRVLANAARMLNDNPSLANLRLLQVIESSKGKATVVIGDGAAGLGPARPGATRAPTD